MSKDLTHIDSSGNPTMVDVSEKKITKRIAHAQAIVDLGPELMSLLDEGEIITKKGPVFQTAIIAGTMAAKKTSELIPFCHPLPIENCKIKISVREDMAVIDSEVSVTSKTGVEMEALTAVSAAALTVYDMCKAVSHNIVIRDTRLMAKTGGKSDFKRNE